MNKRPYIVFGVVVLIVGIFLGEKSFMQNQNKTHLLKVAFPSKQPLEKYEPTNISLDFEYILLENIYSPLVEVTPSGAIESGVAEKTDWVGDELKLTIRSNLKTINGTPIKPEDVIFSLKRLLVLSGNTHGNFKDIVCPGIDLTSTEQDCVGLRIEGQDLYIKAIGGKSFVLTMLSTIDFAVIPKSSVDPKTLKIIDYTQTSGVYSVEKQDSMGKIYLKMNPYHYRASGDIAHEIVLVPTDSNDPESSFKLLKDGHVDHLTTVDQSRIDHVIKFADDNKDVFNSHITQNIRTSFLLFTSKGEKELSLVEREYIGQKVKEAFGEVYKKLPGFESRPEFVPHLSEVGLSESQLNQLKSKNGTSLAKLDKKFKLGLMKAGDLTTWSKPIESKLPTAEMYRESNFPDFKEYKSSEEMPHAIIAASDTGYLEDIGLITYTLNAGILGLNKTERQKWLADYMGNANKADRISKLKDVHFKALNNSVLVPLMSFPYTALVRKPWKIELSDLYANNQFWRVKQQ